MRTFWVIIERLLWKLWLLHSRLTFRPGLQKPVISRAIILASKWAYHRAYPGEPLP